MSTAAPAGALQVVSGAGDLDARYGADVWHAAELGIWAARGRGTASFAGISPPWLKQMAKAWARQRLTFGAAFNTVCAATLAFRRFSGFAAGRTPPLEGPEQLDRALLCEWLAWLAVQPVAEATEALWRVLVRSLLDENHRYRWVPAIPLDAVIYHDEVGCRRRSLPRFIPEFVMGQLESEENLCRLTPQYRHLVVVMTETGLRVGDACTLRADALTVDSAGWPCLRFEAHKMRAEQTVPLSDKAVAAVRDQQQLVAETRPEGSPWLFPCRHDPALSQAYDTFRQAFNRWQEVIGLHDDAGRPVHVVLHQLSSIRADRVSRRGHVLHEELALYLQQTPDRSREPALSRCRSYADVHLKRLVRAGSGRDSSA